MCCFAPFYSCVLLPSQTNGQVNGSKDRTVNQHVRLSEFIEARVDDARMLASIRHFPLARSLEDLHTSKKTKSSTTTRIRFDDDDNDATLDGDDVNQQNDADSDSPLIYDPIYMLTNMYHLLAYSNIVDVVQFTSHSKCLSYVFAALSSTCKQLRLLAYACLYRYVAHLESMTNSTKPNIDRSFH